MSNRRVWIAFFLLAVTWGTSFLFIKIGLRTLQPITLVALRLFVGLVALLAIMRWQKLALPSRPEIWRHLLVMGLINVAIPFVLITWAESGQNGLDSGVASILNSTVPLFSIALSGFILRVESITWGKIVGLAVGFVGVVLLLSRNLNLTATGSIPYLAVILASICYAISSAYARRHLQGLRPVVLSAGQLLIADAIVIVAALLLESGRPQQLPPPTLFAILWLGIMGSCTAYILYFIILQNWGATRATLVTYLLPVVGVTAGWLFLNEMVDWRLIVGGTFILSGVGAVNWRPGRS